MYVFDASGIVNEYVLNGPRGIAIKAINDWWDEHLKWQCISNCHHFRLIIQCYNCLSYRTSNLP